MRRLRKTYRHLIGLDMGSSLVKFVLMERTKHGMAIQGAGLFCPQGRDLDTGEFPQESVARIRAELKRWGLSGLPAASNIEDSSLRIRRVDIPLLPADEVIPAVRWNLKECVDGHIDDHVVCTSPLPSRESGLSVLAYAVRREVIVQQCALIASLGLRPITIEPSAVALLRLCDAVYGWQAHSRYALIDFGTKVSAFTVMQDGVLLFSRPLSGIGEAALLKWMARNLETSAQDTVERLAEYRQKYAERTMSRAESRDGDARADDKPMTEDRLSTTLQHYFSQVLLEIERSIDAFCMMFQTDSVGPLYVTGGASHLPGLVATLDKELGFPLQALSPFAHIPLPAGEGARLQAFSYLFGVSTGLGLLADGGMV